MHRIKYLGLLLLPAILLSACQLFQPLPTLPALLTLPPVEPTTSPDVQQAAPASSTPETASATSIATSAPSQTGPTSTAPSSPAAATTPATTAAPATSEPTKKAPAASATRPAPTAASTSAWKDIPIMPGAADGSEDQGAYSYTVTVSVDDVQAFYDQQMPLAGWEPFATGEGELGNLLLMYQKGNITATIGVIDQSGSTLVLIVAE